jgi:hypothetical protein
MSTEYAFEREEISVEDQRLRIEQRAYEIYLDRGAEPGRDLDDWLQAETEVSAPS